MKKLIALFIALCFTTGAVMAKEQHSTAKHKSHSSKSSHGKHAHSSGAHKHSSGKSTHKKSAKKHHAA